MTDHTIPHAKPDGTDETNPVTLKARLKPLNWQVDCRRLQVVVGVTSAECHISVMSERSALSVVEVVAAGRLLDMAFDRVAA